MNFKNWKIVFVLYIVLQIPLYAQKKLSYTADLQTTIATDSVTPFWIKSIRFGEIPEGNSLVFKAGVFSDFQNSTANFDYAYKASVNSYLSTKNDLFLNELYTSFRFKKLFLDIGVKNVDRNFEGLSSSNGNIMFATNSRSFPGYKVYLNEYIPVPFAKNWLSFKGSFSDYLLNDTRFMDGAKLHHKSLYFKYKLSSSFHLITGIDHYVQWAGSSDLFGKQPSSFTDYLKVITGSSGGSNALEGDQINALGNHLGGYLVQLDYSGSQSNWSFYYSHPFEDASGRELQNIADGIYGFFIDFKNPSGLVSHLVTEFTYTGNMSGENPPDQGHDEFGNSIHGRGRDNYFNNGIYQSGWTYFGNTIGSPFFTTKPVNENGITHGVILGDNRFMAFTIGLKGKMKNTPYRAMLSHVTYFGWFKSYYNPKPRQLSGLFEIQLPKIDNLPFEISAGAALDTGTYRNVNFGGFLKISKRGVF